MWERLASDESSNREDDKGAGAPDVLLYVLLHLYARLGGNGVTLLAERHKERKLRPSRDARGAQSVIGNVSKVDQGKQIWRFSILS